jgi:TRAP-type C4-dicarboxylate transport system permease large subunit
MKAFNVIVYGVVAILLIPALLAGGWIIGLLLAGAWLAVAYGTKHGLEIFKERQSGATAAKYKREGLSLTRERDDGQRWDR